MSYRTPRDVRYRIIAREAVVLRQDVGETLVLNEVGARVLSLLDLGTPLDQVVDALLDEFDVERPALQTDVDTFVQELLTAGILEPIDADPTVPSPTHAGT
ncbi:MAG: PqqD family protein [Acidobacteriota bacterium]